MLRQEPRGRIFGHDKLQRPGNSASLWPFWDGEDVTISNWVVVSNMFYLHLYLGKIHILTNIFQRGWNHQPAKVVCDLQRLGIKFGHGGLNHLALPLQAYENTKPVDATVALVGKRLVCLRSKNGPKTEENREKWVFPKIMVPPKSSIKK